MRIQKEEIRKILEGLRLGREREDQIVRRAKVRIERYKERQAANELIQKERTQQLLNRDVAAIPNLNIRIIKVCRRLGILTVRDLVQHTERDFLYTNKFGEGSLKQLKAALNQLGLCLGLSIS